MVEGLKGALRLPAGRRSCGNARACERLRGAVGCSIPETDYGVRLRAFLAFDNVELDFIAFFERFVSVQLNRRVVDEYIRSVVTSDESVALGVVEPLDLAFVLSHWSCLSCEDTVSLEEVSHRIR